MRALLRGKSSRRHQALIREKTKGLSQAEINERAEEIAAELTVDLIAGWEGWFDAEGQPVPYSVETCRKIVSNYDNRELVDFVNRATDQSAYRAEKEKEEVEKNL